MASTHRATIFLGVLRYANIAIILYTNMRKDFETQPVVSFSTGSHFTEPSFSSIFKSEACCYLRLCYSLTLPTHFFHVKVIVVFQVCFIMMSPAVFFDIETL